MGVTNQLLARPGRPAASRGKHGAEKTKIIDLITASGTFSHTMNTHPMYGELYAPVTDSCSGFDPRSGAENTAKRVLCRAAKAPVGRRCDQYTIPSVSPYSLIVVLIHRLYVQETLVIELVQNLNCNLHRLQTVRSLRIRHVVTPAL